MYDLPSLSNLSRCIVDEATINNEGKPLLVFATPEGRVGSRLESSAQPWRCRAGLVRSGHRAWGATEGAQGENACALIGAGDRPI